MERILTVSQANFRDIVMQSELTVLRLQSARITRAQLVAMSA